MEPAQIELANAIENTPFNEGDCPIYQNVTAQAETKPSEIKSNLIKQLTASVKWTQTMKQMQNDGLTSVTEVGPGKVLQGLFKKMDRALETESAQIL
jgi:[acyl-carrier-protein] S-malonyltransferase